MKNILILMKQFLLILILNLTFLGCIKNISRDNVTNIDETFYYKNDMSLVSGTIIDTFENGQIKEKVVVENGLRNGKSIMWHDNGQILFEGNFKNGVEDGKQKLWEKNGELVLESFVENGIRYKRVMEASNKIENKNSKQEINQKYEHEIIEKDKNKIKVPDVEESLDNLMSETEIADLARKMSNTLKGRSIANNDIKIFNVYSVGRTMVTYYDVPTEMELDKYDIKTQRINQLKKSGFAQTLIDNQINFEMWFHKDEMMYIKVRINFEDLM